MDAVILHEMGHIAHRHSLQALIRSAFTTGLIVLISGDANLLVDAGVGIGALLNDLKNSREHEIDADHYAYEKMLSAGMNPQHFSNILARLSNVSREDTEPMDSVATSSTSVNMEAARLGDYLSTHPNTLDRLNLVKCYSQCFKKGLNKCEHNNYLK
jgi:Zn-dependent protease with chaperone function